MATELELLKNFTLQEEKLDDDIDEDDGIDEGSDDDGEDDGDDDEEDEMEGMSYENIHQNSGDSEESYE